MCFVERGQTLVWHPTRCGSIPQCKIWGKFYTWALRGNLTTLTKDFSVGNVTSSITNLGCDRPTNIEIEVAVCLEWSAEPLNVFLTESACKVVWRRLISLQIHRRVLYYY